MRLSGRVEEIWGRLLLLGVFGLNKESLWIKSRGRNCPGSVHCLLSTQQPVLW